MTKKKKLPNLSKKGAYHRSGVDFYCCNCFDLFKTLADQSVNLVLTSPPYCMGKSYEKATDDLNTFRETQSKTLREAIRVLKRGGSLCWEVGFHVDENEVTPLDFVVFELIDEINKTLPEDEKLKLRGRIVWTFRHGLIPKQRFAGRHETILWYTKGDEYLFDPNTIRISPRYPGKTYSKGAKKGKPSCNPKGMVPSDVWDIPNVKANHIEKTKHPCQFPEAIPARLIKTLTKPGDLVLDPFLGSGTTAVACALNKRKFIGSELKKRYFNISAKRVGEAFDGTIQIRPDVPVMDPDPKSKVARPPEPTK